MKVLGTILIIGVIGFILTILIKADIERGEWLSAHCQKIGEVAGSTGFGPAMSSNGTMGFATIYTPGKTGYQCDDGMQYWE
jgi:hypothetical protein